MNVKTLCLGSLCLCEEATGYDIKKLFEEAFSHFHSASFGSIYPSLNQLQQDGLIDLRVEPGERHPDRKIYSITPQGRQSLVEELLQAEPGEQIRSDFLVLLFFAHLLPNARVAWLLDRMIERYRHELEYLESIRDAPEHTAGIRFTIRIGITAVGAKLKFLQQQRDEFLREHAREIGDETD